MSKRHATAVWESDLQSGSGTMRTGSDAFQGRYSFASRFEEEKGTHPEELVGAAHAGCFSMALAHPLAEAGYRPARIHTEATVQLVQAGEGFAISTIDLVTDGGGSARHSGRRFSGNRPTGQEGMPHIESACRSRHLAPSDAAQILHRAPPAALSDGMEPMPPRCEEDNLKENV